MVALITKTVADLMSFVDRFKNDINERNELHAPGHDTKGASALHPHSHSISTFIGYKKYHCIYY